MSCTKEEEKEEQEQEQEEQEQEQEQEGEGEQQQQQQQQQDWRTTVRTFRKLNCQLVSDCEVLSAGITEKVVTTKSFS